MEKKVISIEQTSEDLCKVFGITEDNKEDHGKHSEKSFYIPDGHQFMISKLEYEREEVIEKLTDYFKDKVIDKGACTVDNITCLYTKFEIAKL
jgi:hypothetical protein